jgi:hypothetical protein
MPRPAPAALLLLAAAVALATAAPAAGASVLETIAREYKDAMPACAGLLYPPSAELEAASMACWLPIRDDADAPPAACPSPECGAYAAAMGRACWEEFNAAHSEAYDAAAAALSGDAKAMPAAAAAKFQALQDAIAAVTVTGDASFDVAAKIATGDAALAAELQRAGAYRKALVAACAPGAAAPAPAPAPVASVLEVVGREYAAAVPACAGLLSPPSAELVAAADACWRPLNSAADAPPAACPSPECGAYARALGAACWAEFHAATGGAYAAAADMLTGGKAMPAADMAKLQALEDAIAASDPEELSFDVAKLAAGDAALAAELQRAGAYRKALVAACAPGAEAAPPAAAASGGARAGAAAAAARLLPLLAL